MSQAKCTEVKKLLKDVLAIIRSGAIGQGKGVSLADTHIEDAVLRVDYHQRQMGWLNTPGLGDKTTPASTVNPVTRIPVETMQQKDPAKPSTLKPAANIPTLRTGLMNPEQSQSVKTPAAKPSTAPQRQRSNGVVQRGAVSGMDDVSL